MNETYTVKEVIEITRNQLGEIVVPVKYKNIIDGINSAINNLNAVIEAMNRTEEKPEEVVEQHEDDNNAEGDAQSQVCMGSDI